MPRSTKQVKRLQRALNYFTEHYTEGLAPIRVDGVRGPATNHRARQCLWLLGYHRPLRPTRLPRGFVYRLWNPRSLRFANTGLVARGIYRRRNQRRHNKKNYQAAARQSGVTTFDGRPVAKWLKPYLEWAREQGWRGTLNSGWRDPRYSESLCYQICGRPSCPGRCAGRASNHSGSTPGRGAVDVSDYHTFGNLMRRCPIEPRIHNVLGAADPVHFSASGR